jgi:hypothetical protein
MNERTFSSLEDLLSSTGAANLYQLIGCQYLIINERNEGCYTGKGYDK